MSLKAKERILKLRETEYKLQKLQNDLLNGKKAQQATLTEFLEHHRELSKLPGSDKNSIPFRFPFESSQRYAEAHNTQRLTLPPIVDAASNNRMREYKEHMEMSDKLVHAKSGLANHPSLAMHTLLTEIDQKNSKMAVAFPKLDKMASINRKTPHLRNLHPLNSKRYVKSDPNANVIRSPASKKSVTGKAKRGAAVKPKTSTALLFSRKTELVSVSQTPSKIGLTARQQDYKGEGGAKFLAPTQSVNESDFPFARRYDSEDLRRSVAYALEASNLMGVILPTRPVRNMNLPAQRGPWAWQAPQESSILSVASPLTVSEEPEITVREALNLLRKRRFPERKTVFLPKRLQPHERGLIGVEISGFEPECAFFYRDRNGEYNPHLRQPRIIPSKKKSVRIA